MWRIEPSSLGRIAVPPQLPDGVAVFATSIDFDGRLDHEAALRISTTIRDRFALESTLNTCHQVHGADVRRVQRSEGWQECDTCDGLWSDERAVALGIKVADCLPVTMVDPGHSVIANVHSGWRGAIQRITSGAVDSLTRSSTFRPADAIAYLGPSIRVCCFEVGEEVASQFDERFVDRSHTKAHVDLVSFTIDLLRSVGVTQISDSELCTRCEGSIFHSYRRGANGGRNLAIVAQG